MRLIALSCALVVCFAGSTARAEPAKTISLDLGIALLEMVLVPKGEESQGSPATEKGRDADERAHEVALTADYYIGKYPVTRRQFAAFVRATAYRTEAELGASGGFGWDSKELVQKKEFTWHTPGFAQGDDEPVTLVTFKDAEAFAGWVSTKTGRHVTLPSEAQWEHAARAGTTTAYYAGDGEEAALSTGWFKKNAGAGTRPVGTKAPNAFGLYDMTGNVFEWCRDWYSPYPAGRLVDPVVETPSGDTPRRVLRGGSWLRDPRWGRSAARYKNAPGSRNADNGFRVLASVEEPAPKPQAPVIPPAPEPVRAPVAPPRPPESSGVSPIVLLAGAGGVAAVLFLLLRRRVSQGAASAPDGPTIRTGEDGFWIEGGFAAGTRVKYACTVRGVPVTDTVALEGERTFVYTGGVPENARVLEVTQVRDDAAIQAPLYRGATPPVAPARVVVAPPDSDPPPPPAFQGFPPAY